MNIRGNGHLSVEAGLKVTGLRVMHGRTFETSMVTAASVQNFRWIKNIQHRRLWNLENPA